eukprot:gene725-1394_t
MLFICIFLSIFVGHKVKAFLQPPFEAYLSKKHMCRNRFIQPSNIYSSSLSNTDSDQQGTLNFGGVKYGHPLSTALRNMNITSPTPIQKVAIGPLTAGISAILHAETGSGKTLAYLLPLLKRLLHNGKMDTTPLQALIIVPTKELASQIAADITSLVSTGSELDTSAVHLCITTSRTGLDKVKAPIVVGTPFKLLDCLAVSASPTAPLANLGYIVLDEVDRLIGSIGKYASNEEKRDARRDDTPAVQLLTKLIQYRDQKKLDIQIVAASATVGRPMRRDLFRLLQGESGKGAGNNIDNENVLQGNFEIIRPNTIPDADNTLQRAVGIPSTIRHLLILYDGAEPTAPNSAKSSKPSSFGQQNRQSQFQQQRQQHQHDGGHGLTGRLAVAKEKWISMGTKRALVFVPHEDEVQHILGVLRFWGIGGAKDLQHMLGISSPRPVAVTRPNRSGMKSREPAVSRVVERKLTTNEIISKAAQNRIGSIKTSTSTELRTDLEELTSESSDDTDENQPEILVVPMSGSRGLHIQNVDTVFVLQPPRTMDEYLHLAGRTGRAGNDGTVVSFVNLDELKRMQSWQTPLGIQFEVKDQCFDVENNITQNLGFALQL